LLLSLHSALVWQPSILQGKCGYIDPKGKIIIQPQFYNAYKFSEGLAAIASNSSRGEHRGAFGYIDTTGIVAIEPQFYNGGFFVEGMAQVKLDPDEERWGYINKKGEIIFPSDLGDFHDDLCHLKIKASSSYWGYIDKQGKWVFREDEAEELYKKMPNGEVVRK
jgi:hypothetical protein